MKRIVIWAAVSSLPQAKKISLEDQIRVGRDHAARYDATVVAELIVPGESRDIVLFEEACRRIEAYDRLRSLIEAKAFDVLIYLDRSRLGRTAALSMAVAELCNRAGILLYETESPLQSLEFKPADHSDMLIGAIKSVDAQQEIRKIQERHRKGMKNRVEKGKMPGKVNFGYLPQYEGGKLIGYTIDEVAATTIKLIVSLYLDRGFGALNIGDHLNRLGREAPKGGQWGHSQVTFLLRRIWRYAGFAELNVYSRTGRPYIRAKGQWPAIISEEDARRVIAERKARNDTRRSVHTVYRFTRMVYCGICDSRLHAQTKTRTWMRENGTQGHTEYVVYRCPADHGMIGEKKIITAMEKFLDMLNNNDEFYSQWTAMPIPDQSAGIIQQITTLNNQLDKLKAGITKADLDYYSHGALEKDENRYQAIVSSIKKQMTVIAAQITILQDTLHEEERNHHRKQRIDDISAHGMIYLHSTDIRTANAWLREHLHIVIENRQVTDIGLNL